MLIGSGGIRPLQADASVPLVKDWNAGAVNIQAASLSAGGAADASAILALLSTTKGFLPPAMTTAQRDAIVSPTTGLLIWNTTIGRSELYNGVDWLPYGVGEVFLGSITASNDATVEFIAGIDATYRFYKIHFWAIPASDWVSLILRVSTDGGSSWKSGAADYRWVFQKGGATDLSSNSAGDNKILMGTGDNGSDTGEGISGEIVLVNPSSVSMYQHIHGRMCAENRLGEIVSTLVSGSYQAAVAVNALQFKFAAGNIESGEFSLYGVH